MRSLIMRPVLVRPRNQPHDIPTLPVEPPARDTPQDRVNWLQVGVSMAHDTLPQIIDAVSHMRGLHVHIRLDSVEGGVIAAS